MLCQAKELCSTKMVKGGKETIREEKGGGGRGGREGRRDRMDRGSRGEWKGGEKVEVEERMESSTLLRRQIKGYMQNEQNTDSHKW